MLNDDEFINYKASSDPLKYTNLDERLTSEV